MAITETDSYILIPSHVCFNKKLPDGAKILYGEILLLSQKDGFCWATNNYFAKKRGVSKNTISRWVQALTEEGLITTKMEKNEDGAFSGKRFILMIE